MGSHGVPGMYVLYGALGVPIALGVAQRWRRLASSPVLLPGEAAQLYATRSEAQIGADWMCIPAARNLHWRYQILRQAFLVCKAKVAPGESGDVNLQVLVKAATSLFERLQRGTINTHGKPLPLNGDLLFIAPC